MYLKPIRRTFTADTYLFFLVKQLTLSHSVNLIDFGYNGTFLGFILHHGLRSTIAMQKEPHTVYILSALSVRPGLRSARAELAPVWSE
jgi:hypothetical protein